jgi:hypothetical protein
LALVRCIKIDLFSTAFVTLVVSPFFFVAVVIAVVVAAPVVEVVVVGTADYHSIQDSHVARQYLRLVESFCLFSG